MPDRDVVSLAVEHVPDEIITLRDTIAAAEAGRPGHVWERHRDVYDDIKKLKDRCEENGHPLVIALTGKPGTRRRLMRNGRDARRTCVMCGTEEVGRPANGFLYRFLFGRTRWTFEKLNGHITRAFRDPEWYFETMSIVRQYSLPTDIVLYRAFPPRLPSSILANER